MIKIICWNINSIRPRMPILEKLIEEQKPDILLLQEIKCLGDKFPYLELESYGYNISVYGQKTYNGVAILSKGIIEDVSLGIPNFVDDQARYIECITTINGITIRVASIYVPNGSEIGSDKFTYKLEFLKNLKGYLDSMINLEEIFILGGDYNVACQNLDVYDSKRLEGKICFNIDERKLLREIQSIGYYDTFRCLHPNSQQFSWWDYRGRSLSGDEGLRIDYILASPEAMDKIASAEILKEYRLMDKTSDHAPVMCQLK